MKRVLLTIFILFTTLSVNATESTDYLKSVYQPQYERKLKVVSKEEFIDKYDQYFNGVYIPSISYGYGYMKVKRCKKVSISYICILDCDGKPIWGAIIPTKDA